MCEYKRDHTINQMTGPIVSQLGTSLDEESGTIPTEGLVSTGESNLCLIEIQLDQSFDL